MDDCVQCGRSPDLPRRCQYCDAIVCSEHRLPESHNCDGVEFLSDGNKRFRTKFDDTVVTNEEEIDSPEPVDPEHTVGTTPNDLGDSSPDVALDGSIEDDGTGGGSESDDESGGLLARLKSLF